MGRRPSIRRAELAAKFRPGRSDFIPFNRPARVGAEFKFISQALAGGHISGNGPFTRRCESLLREELGVAGALLTTSCTHALEMAALLLDFKPGDEFIVPTFTFVSTANAFVLRGGRPIFADIRSDTLNLDEEKIERLVTRRTRALVPVHYGGVGCEMDRIQELTAGRGIAVVEDNAHGLFGKYRNRWLGTFGDLATLSFHETKNFSCGEGGALLINDRQHLQRAEIIREKGTNRAQLFRGEVDKYTWLDLGSSYVPSDLLAAFLLAQLEQRDIVQRRRRRIWEYYRRHLADWAREHGVKLPVVPHHCSQAYHLFYLITPSLRFRQGLITHLRKKNICAVFHYLPIHLSAMGRSMGGEKGDCPVAEKVSDRLLRLPLFYSITNRQLQRVIEAVIEYRGSGRTDH